jgi:DNA polymerase-3 subunit delta
MAEISYSNLKAYLNELASPSGRAAAPVHLIHGEDLFVRTAFEEILRRIHPGAPGSLNYEPIDGATASIGDVVACLNTYALMGGTKVVALRDARLFHAREDAGRLLESARKARAEGDLPRAAKHFLAALAQMHLSLEDMRAADRSAHFPDGYDPGEDDAWVEAVLEHCVAARLSVPQAADGATLLEKAIEHGFPQGHHLIITTDLIDRRRGLYRIIREKGVVIDCAVPKGERRVDKEAQEAVLAEHLKAILEPARKTMNRAAFLTLCEMTGFDPGTFSNNLQILIDYAGARREITAEDVEAVLERTKKDPLYELTNAVADRNWGQSLFFLDSLLGDEIHGLQVLAAIANQVRKLLLAKDFAESAHGAAWHPACTYPQFQKTGMPAVLQFDRERLARIESWDTAPADTPAEGRKRKKAKASTDLQLARNPGNPFPVYQVLKKSERFSRADLLRVLEALSEADLRLKSSTLNPRFILERVVWQLCAPASGKTDKPFKTR